jgi:hypothetical protein
VWVIGDLFQQYAVKYAGITRGIPLSNTNQLWGLLWAVLVFGELRGTDAPLGQVIGGSLVMALGAAAIAFASVSRRERVSWQAAAAREGDRYGVDPAYTKARAEGREAMTSGVRRSWIDWVVVAAATATLIGFAAMARAPQLPFDLEWAAGLALVTLGILAGCGLALWRTTRFN